jgi:aspartyl/asparaginyl beta-hydroxylase (cupin superfamily)
MQKLLDELQEVRSDIRNLVDDTVQSSVRRVLIERSAKWMAEFSDGWKRMYLEWENETFDKRAKRAIDSYVDRRITKRIKPLIAKELAAAVDRARKAAK